MRFGMMLAALFAGAMVMAAEYSQSDCNAKFAKVNQAKAEAADIQAALDYVAGTTATKDYDKMQLLRLYGFAVGHQDSVADFAAYNKLVSEKEAALGFSAALAGDKKCECRNAWWRLPNATVAVDEAKAKAWAQGMMDYIKSVGAENTFTSAGTYAKMLGNYSEAYAMFVASDRFYDRAMKLAVDPLKDDALVLDAFVALSKSKRVGARINSDEIAIIKNCLAVAQSSLLTSDADMEQLKAALARLNRKVSPLLAQDKATWEPIVAQIRLMLSAL